MIPAQTEATILARLRSGMVQKRRHQENIPLQTSLPEKNRGDAKPHPLEGALVRAYGVTRAWSKASRRAKR